MNSQYVLPVGHKVRWYEIEALIGYGALCHTYLAIDHNLQRQVVIKEFFPGKVCVRNEDFTVAPSSAHLEQSYQGLKDNFIAEAKTLAQYRLENLVQVHTTFELNKTAYLVMTYEQGQSLAALIAESAAPLEQKLLLDILSPIVAGLSKVHNVHVIHGDINPSNIIVRPYGAPVLVDFGSSRSIASRMRWQHPVPPDASCVPIELLNGTAGAPGVWSDIYSLSATLYNAVTQQGAIDAMERAGAVNSGNPDPYKPLTNAPKRQYDPHFLSAIDSGLALHPQTRPSTLQVWENQLKNIEDPFRKKPSVANNNALLPRKSGAETPDDYRRGKEALPAEKAVAAKPDVGVTAARLIDDVAVSRPEPVDAVAGGAKKPIAPIPPAAVNDPSPVQPDSSFKVQPQVPPVLVASKANRWSRSGVLAGMALLLVPGVYLGIENYPSMRLQAADITSFQEEVTSDSGYATIEDEKPAITDVPPADTTSVSADPEDGLVSMPALDENNGNPSVNLQNGGSIVAAPVELAVASPEADIESIVKHYSPDIYATEPWATAEPADPAVIPEPTVAVERAAVLAESNASAEQKQNNPTVAKVPESEQIAEEIKLRQVAIPEQFVEPSLPVETIADSATKELVPQMLDMMKIDALIASVNCGSIEPSNDGSKLDGVITQTAFELLRDDTSVSLVEAEHSDLVVLDDVFCAPLLLLDKSMNPGKVSLETENNKSLYREGDRLVLNLATTAFETNYLYVDYFTMDGSVLHMLSSTTTLDSEANQLLYGESMWLGEPGDIERWDLLPPFGREMISVLVSDAPLDIESSAEIEDAQAYLDRVKRVLSTGNFQTASNFTSITIEE